MCNRMAVVNSEFAITSNNYSSYGTHAATYSTTDMVNNTSQYNPKNHHPTNGAIETATTIATSSETLRNSEDGLIALSSFIVILSITTVLSNGLVIHVLKTDKTLHTVSNYFALSLTISDMLVGLIIIPLNLLTYHVPGNQYWFIKGVWVTLDFLLTTVSILNLVLLNLDRFWSITSPIKYMRQRTKRRTLYLIASVWGFATVMTLIPATIWPYSFKGIYIPAKTEFVYFGSSAWLMATISICVFFIPLIVLCAIYSRIFKAIHSRSKLDLGRSNANSSLPKKGSELQQGLINEKELHRLQLIYDKAVKRDRGERQISALKKKLKHQYVGTGAKRLQRYESINEDIEGSNNSLRHSDKGSVSGQQPRNDEMQIPIPTLTVEKTSSSSSLEKKSPTKDFLSVAWNSREKWLGRRRVASVDMIRDRGNSFCSDTTGSKPVTVTLRSTSSRSCEILPVQSSDGKGITKSDSRRSLPANRRASPSGSPKIAASSMSSRASIDNHSSSNYLQIFPGADGGGGVGEKYSNILRSRSSPGLNIGDSTQTTSNDDDDNESLMTSAGEVSIAVPVIMPLCKCPRMRTLSTESSSPPTSPKEITDATSLLPPHGKSPPSPTGSFRERLHTRTARLRRNSFSVEMLTRPSSDSGYCSEGGFRPASSSFPQRQQSLSVPENIHAIRDRVRNSFSNSFSLISGHGSKALSLLKRQDKAARQLGFVLSCLITCWTPYFVLLLLYSIRPELANITAMSISVYLGYLHSLCNPILFTMFNLRFQRSFKKILCPCTPIEDVPRHCSAPPPSML